MRSPFITTPSTSSLTDTSSTSSKWLWLVLIFIAIGGIIYLAKNTDYINQVRQLIMGMGKSISTPIQPVDEPELEPELEQEQEQQQPVQQQHQPVQQQQQQQQQQPVQQPPASYPQSNNFPPNQNQMEPMPASAMDSENKSGWCYVGEQQDFRSCIDVGEFDKCMSGDIFSTKDICINPNLRA